MHRVALRLSARSFRSARCMSQPPSTLARTRSLHTRKELSYPIEGGLNEFLPPSALKMIAEDYQQGLLERLNEEVKRTEQEHKSVVQTLIDASTDPTKVLAFNYASEALNNSFFLETLKPLEEGQTSHEHALSQHLAHRIRADFGSLAQLKSNFGAAALGMFSSGWLWLVCDQLGNLAVYPTFGTGTLLVRSRNKLYDQQHIVGQSFEEPGRPASHAGSSQPPAPTSPTSGASHQLPPLHPSSPSRTFATAGTPSSLFDGNMTAQTPSAADITRVGEKLYPLLCLSMHEHAWVAAGYGVWGKQEYVKRFWSVVNWEKYFL
ncbi:hypothetical protein ABKN59_000104 [Abortiporus biennis]